HDAAPGLDVVRPLGRGERRGPSGDERAGNCGEDGDQQSYMFHADVFHTAPVTPKSGGGHHTDHRQMPQASIPARADACWSRTPVRSAMVRAAAAAHHSAPPPRSDTWI